METEEFYPYSEYCEFCGEELDGVRINYPPDNLLLQDGTYLTLEYHHRYVDICWHCL